MTPTELDRAIRADSPVTDGTRVGYAISRDLSYTAGQPIRAVVSWIGDRQQAHPIEDLAPARKSLSTPPCVAA